jgi:hypothetical protein
MAADFAPHELLIQFNAHASEQAKAAAFGQIAATVREHIHTPAMRDAGEGELVRVTLPGQIGIEQAIQHLQNNPAIEHAEPNWIFHTNAVSNDPYYTQGYLWGAYGDGTSPANVFGSQAGEAWALNRTGSYSVAVGIVDEGIDFNHPDLAANIWTNPGEIVGDGIDNDGNGYIDDIHGWDFYSNDNTVYDGSSADTVDHHGTHVAGTIGAVGGNGQGVAGMAWQTKMISTKFMGPDGGYLSSVVKALDYLTTLKTKYGVNIVASNNSWSGGGYSSTLQSAIVRGASAGILFIAAAGNASNNNDSSPSYPPAYNTASSAGYDAVISVAAIDQSGNLAWFSNYGATTVDLAAPGVGIYSTLPGNTYGGYSGTSMAAPHVTGAAVLYAAANPGASASTIRNAILASAQATPTASLAGKTVTGGRLNISAMPQTQPSISINDASIVEGNSGTSSLVFTVKLSKPSTETISVNYASSNITASAGSDYTAASGSLSFAPGVTSRTISVPVAGDTVPESNETFAVNLSGAVKATIADGQGIGTIINDDVIVPTLPAVSVDSITLNEGNRGWTRFTFRVSLSAASTQPISVSYATLGGTATAGVDFRSASGTLNFSPGTTSLAVTISVSGDKTVEGDETFYLQLNNPVNAVLSALRTGTATIRNDDGGTATGRGAAAAADTADRSLQSSASAIDLLMASLGDNLQLTSTDSLEKRGRLRSAV